jgi:hypothetical protein
VNGTNGATARIERGGAEILARTSLAKKANRRCLKPPFAAPPKETGTGQRAVLCPRRDGHPEERSVHVMTRPCDISGSRVGGDRLM